MSSAKYLFDSCPDDSTKRDNLLILEVVPFSFPHISSAIIGIKDLINDFSKPTLNFRPSILGSSEDILENGYMYLLECFTSGAGKKGGEF